jgi:hypothetical protein
VYLELVGDVGSEDGKSNSNIVPATPTKSPAHSPVRRLSNDHEPSLARIVGWNGALPNNDLDR